jgi:GR25 family glycosyltransferase involved in LPS biosynthesis
MPHPSRQPTVSICTPTGGRLAWLPLLHRCLLAQRYPRELMEWVVCDDGPEPAQDLLESLCRDNLRLVYERPSQKLPLGEKRNRLNRAATGDILVYCDDDDYYPPERVGHAVERLIAHPEIPIVGSTILPTYFIDTAQVWHFGPYGPRHATAGTFAFRRGLLSHTAFPPEAGQAEERAFLQNYRIPLVQLDPAKTILCFNHGQNTFDKRQILPRAGRPAPRAKRIGFTLDQLIPDPELRSAYQELFQRSPTPPAQAVPPPAAGDPAAEKLAGLPLIVYINCEADTAKRTHIENLFRSHARPPERIAATTPATLGLHLDAAHPIAREMTPIEYCITVSHLRALQLVVRQGVDYALILEDDITLDTVPFWRFTLPELIASLPPDWGVVQLQVILSVQFAKSENGRRLITPEFNPMWALHPHRSNIEWGASAYLIRRDHAHAILKTYSPDPEADPLPVDLTSYPYRPVADSLLFAPLPAATAGTSAKAYCLPLFVSLPKAFSNSMPRDLLHQVTQDYARAATLIRLQQLPGGLTLETALRGDVTQDPPSSLSQKKISDQCESVNWSTRSIEPEGAAKGDSKMEAGNVRPLAGLPLIVYINCEADTGKRTDIERLFQSHPSPMGRLAATTPTSLNRHLVRVAPVAREMSPVELSITVSHLRALQHVVRRGSGYALILEDDITLETLPYWGFTLAELVAALPSDWGIVQLQCVLPIRITGPENGRQKIIAKVEPIWSLHLHRLHLEWGAAAYLIRRDLALALLKSYSPDPEADPLPVDLSSYPHPPVADSLLYAPPPAATTGTSARAYSLPLFAPTPKARSRSMPRDRGQQVMQDYARAALLHRLQQMPGGLTLEAALRG